MVLDKLLEQIVILNEVYKKKGLEFFIAPNHYWLEIRVLKYFKLRDTEKMDVKAEEKPLSREDSFKSDSSYS